MGCRKLAYYEGEEGLEKSPLKILGGLEEKNGSSIFCIDYYPFGLVMNQYLSNGEKYRFGYQGDFAEDDTEETGFNHFELREYDSRIARWMVPDPYREYWSPYLAMGNDPINLVDPDGGSTDPCPECDAADAQWGDLAAQNAVTATRLPSSTPTPGWLQSVGSWLRRMDQSIQGNVQVTDAAVQIIVLGKKGSNSADGYKPNSKSNTIVMNEDEFELLKMAMSRMAGYKKDWLSLTDQKNSGKRNSVYTMNKEAVKTVSKERLEFTMNLNGLAREQAARNNNNAVLQMKSATEYPFYDPATLPLPSGADAAGTSPLKANPDSLIQRRIYNFGVRIQTDTLRIK